jgi:hypothetical protein
MYAEVPTPSSCVADDVIEAYSLGHLTDEVAVASIEEHLLVCTACQDRLEVDDTYNATMRAALVRIALTPVEVLAVHDTSEGPVYLWVQLREDGRWTSRITGTQMDGGAAQTSRRNAIDYNEVSFRALYPEHECSDSCRSNVALNSRQ